MRSVYWLVLFGVLALDGGPAMRADSELQPDAFTPAPNLGLLSVVVSDPLPGGNNDGWVQPGETVTLQVALSNFGSATATGVFGTLNPGESNPYLTILDKVADWPNVPAHGVATTLPSHFLIQVSNTLPCGYVLELSLAVQSTNYSATIPIRLDLSRPYSFDVVADATRRYNESDAVVFGADPNDAFGYSVAAGDFNGDGFDDLILGAPFADGPGNAKADAGSAVVVYGASDGMLPTMDTTLPPAGTTILHGADVGDMLGWVVSAGDLNGDGFDEILLGVSEADGPANNRNVAGEVWVIYGQAAALPATIDLAVPPSNAKVIFGPDSGDRLGTAVSVGDVNGDGFGDLVLGGYGGSGPGNGRSSAGEVWVIYGQAEPLPVTTDLFSPPSSAKVIYAADFFDALGGAVTAADLDGDGFDDLVLAAVHSSGPANARVDAGEVWVIYGQAEQLPSIIDLFAPPANAKVLYGVDANDFTGSGVVGDVNGDGFDDLVLSASGGDAAGNAKSNAGEVWVIFGQPGRLPAAIDLSLPPSNARVVYGGDAGDFLGSVGTGDVNGDGFDDLVLGASAADAAGNAKLDAGEVHVVNGFATTTYWNKAETYAFVDASVGMDLGLACDDCSTSIPIGFAFPFYGEKFTTVHVSSNGFVSFAPIHDAVSANVRCISSKSPTSLSSQPLLIAPFWDDLDLRTSGSVRALLSGTAPDRRLTIAWIGVPHYPNTGAATFEVSLFESTGQILFQYQDVDFGNPLYSFGASASVGVQNRTAAEGTPYLCTTAGVASSQAVSFNLNTPLFVDNMESISTAAGKPGKWSMAGGSPTQWRTLTNPACFPSFHGRIRSLYEGLDLTCAYANNIAGDTLTFPQVSSFPADGRIAYWEAFQSQASADLGRLEVQGNGGGFTTLVTQSGGTGTWQAATPVFLGAQAGQAVDLRFRFTSDATITARGWMLDDVRLVGCNAKGISSFASAAAFAHPPLYCGDGSRSGLLDAVGSFCGDGSQPVGFQWIEQSSPISGATEVRYTVPANHPAGSFDFSVAVTCAGGSATSATQEVEIVAPASPVGGTLLLDLENSDANLRLTWVNASGSTSYVVYEDTAASGAFASTSGTATSGVSGLTLPTPAAPLVFYLVAGSNETCGAGPKR